MKFVASLVTILAIIATVALFGAVGYFVIFFMLVGGIVQIVEACKQVDIPAVDVAWGIGRVLLAGLSGTIGFWAAFFGSALIWTGVKGLWDSTKPRSNFPYRRF